MTVPSQLSLGTKQKAHQEPDGEEEAERRGRMVLVTPALSQGLLMKCQPRSTAERGHYECSHTAAHDFGEADSGGVWQEETFNTVRACCCLFQGFLNGFILSFFFSSPSFYWFKGMNTTATHWSNCLLVWLHTKSKQNNANVGEETEISPARLASNLEHKGCCFFFPLKLTAIKSEL